ncbi:hypothetical protein [Hymenobacter sp. DG25A]|uniref:hypothetical protein n=1 Tax=Hymenobacter sp. DG25A TaxID=1385663 RepID=UPI0006BE0FAA|nr:hypothetical protein [Hymenobacter sp. DG25A]ALD20603.1 hypothetical protein AM218_04410 [Hymenobacter sp. DG25A]
MRLVLSLEVHIPVQLAIIALAVEFQISSLIQGRGIASYIDSHFLAAPVQLEILWIDACNTGLGQILVIQMVDAIAHHVYLIVRLAGYNPLVAIRARLSGKR